MPINTAIRDGRHGGVSTTSQLTMSARAPAVCGVLRCPPAAAILCTIVLLALLGPTDDAVPSDSTAPTSTPTPTQTQTPTPSPFQWPLLPQPARVLAAASGRLRIAEGATVSVRGTGSPALKPMVDQFLQRVANTRGLHLRRAAASTVRPTITFELDPKATVTGDSAYRLVVDAQGIRVTARSPAGAFYGSVTLWQLLTPQGFTRGEAAQIAQGVIEDHPHFPWRGLLLDSGRHFQSVADIQQLIDWMSLAKLNVLLWHLTEDQGWRLEIPQYPELTRTGACRKAVGLDIELTGGADKPYCGFYTAAQVRDIVRYAAERFVTIVPEIDLPGHSQAAVAAYPWLGVTGERPPVWTDWGISPWLLKPDEKTVQLVESVLDEVMQLFPSRYISIGGDEADKQQWNASPELRTQMHRLGLANMDQLQGWFVQRIAQHLKEHGRRAVGWDDPLMAGVQLDPSQVVMTWHGDHGLHWALEAARAGHEVILTPQESLYFDYYQSDLPDEGPGQPPMTALRQVYATATRPEGATAADAARIIGVQGNLWTELMPGFAQDQHALFPRLAALSELGWSPPGERDWSSFLARLPAELGRYRALGIGYSDTAFAPAFEVTAPVPGVLRVAISNQAGFGEIRYTTDGSVPDSSALRYERPLEFLTRAPVTLRAASLAPGGFALAEPRTQVLDASTMLRREGSQLDSCQGQPATRVEGIQPGEGAGGAHRPVYRMTAGDMCWVWSGAALPNVHQVSVTVSRVAWRFGDEAQGATVRPTSGLGAQIEIHADTCTGPLLARLPLSSGAAESPWAGEGGETELTAAVSELPAQAAHALCLFATGDPREGQWVLARVAFK